METQLNPNSNWVIDGMQCNVAYEPCNQEGPIHPEAHGCYDMGYDSDTTSVPS